MTVPTIVGVPKRIRAASIVTTANPNGPSVRTSLPQSGGVAFIEAGEGKVHLTCKDVSV